MSRLKVDTGSRPVPVQLDEDDTRVQALQAVEDAPKTPEDFVERISKLWTNAQNTFLDIGRLLIRAKETLSHGEYTAGVEKHLPFSVGAAYQLREAARWAIEMDRRKEITIDALPNSYTTIYLLSTLEPPDLGAAKEEGIIRPELRRAELISWKKAKKQNPQGVDRTSLLAEQRDRLIRERARVDAELHRIEIEMRVVSLEKHGIGEPVKNPG
jgi:hypothetical protein